MVMNKELLQVVLADDDKEDCLIFSDAVADLSIKIDLTVVGNGDKLMALLQEFIPDILFLDIHMPCRDGWQCIKEIRANPLYDKLPVIMFSGMGDKDIMSYFYREGANHFLIKPYTMDDLKQSLEIIFSNFPRYSIPLQ